MTNEDFGLTTPGDVLNVIRHLASRGGHVLTQGEEQLLALRIEEAESLPDVELVREAVLRGFFAAATEGVAYVDLDEIPKYNLYTVAEAYPEGSKSFLKFATTFWSLKTLLKPVRDSRVCGVQVLWDLVEDRIGGLFFTHFRFQRINPDHREQSQREVLARYAPGIEVEDFIAGNAVLIRDRKEAGPTPRRTREP